jgi:hypothetical protein
MVATKASANGSAESTRFAVNKNGGLQRVECRLTGTSPVLFNAMARDILLGLITKEKAAKTAERPDVREIAASKLHLLPDGRPCTPPRMLYACLIAAGQFVRLDGKRQVSSATSTTLPGLLTLNAFEIPLLQPGSEESAVWEVDVQQGRNPNGGEAVGIVRPCFYKWELNVEFAIDRKVFPVEAARGLVELAGRRCGIGDFRPNRKGVFGQFCITRWELID